MASSLANVYAKLREWHTEDSTDIQFSEAPSYIKTLTGLPNGKVIFLYKLGNKRCSPSHGSTKMQKAANTSVVDLDLTGSPLKDDCVISVLEDTLDIKFSVCPWNSVEETFTAISIEEARAIANRLNFEQLGKCNGSVWFLCNGLDSNKTVLLERYFNASWNYSGIVSFLGVCQSKDIQITDMMKQHNAMLPSRSVETNIETHFNITPDISIQLNWTTASQNLVLTAHRNADILLHLRSTVGCENSVLNDLWRQLLILHGIKEDIIQYKERYDDSGEVMYRYGLDVKFDEISNGLQRMLSDMQTFSLPDEANQSTDITEVINRCKNRNLVDITERLWDLLKFFSYKSLKKSLNFVFQFAAKCTVVNLPTADNRLAEFIREISQQRLVAPCLSGLEPLELLLEIGLQKVTKDYEIIAQESQICSKAFVQQDSSLNQKNTIDSSKNRQSQRKTLLQNNKIDDSEDSSIGTYFQNSNFKRKDVESKLDKLGRFHMILEHLLLVHSNLLGLDDIYPAICENAIQKLPISFDVLSTMKHEKLDMVINDDKILRQIEGHHPNSRRISICSENQFRRVENVFYHSVECIFPPNVCSVMQIEEKDLQKEVEKSVHYWCWNYMKIGYKKAL